MSLRAAIMRETSAAFLLVVGLPMGIAQAPVTQVVVHSDPVPVEHLSEQLTSIDRPLILALTREVFALAGASGPYEDVARPFIELTAESQVQFLEGKIPSSSEECVAKIVNDAAMIVRAPKYLRTDEEEVHRLRESLATVEPSFIGRLDLKQRTPARPLGKLMSPLEAFHVVSLLIRQKLYNPEYQMTPEERVKLIAGSPDKKPRLPTLILARRQEEIESMIQAAPRTISIMDMFALADVSFKSIGIGVSKRTAD